MRLQLLIMAVLGAGACAEAVGPSAADVLAMDAVADGAGVPDETAVDGSAAVCSTRFRRCSRDAAVSGCNEGCDDCVQRAVVEDGVVYRAEAFCGRSAGLGCTPGFPTGSCSEVDFGETPTCLTFYVPSERRFQASLGECYGASTCLEVLRREASSFPASVVARDRCWYSDRTVATTGRPGPADCLAQPLQTCGTGCAPCADGYDCVWSSERSPTGLCLQRTGREPSGRFISPPCWSLASPGRACPEGASCLKPLRDDADGVPDSDRPGICVPDDRCNAVAIRFSAGYRCDNSPLTR